MSNDTNRTDAGIRSEQDKRNGVSVEEGSFWKREEGQDDPYIYIGRYSFDALNYDLYFTYQSSSGRKYLFCVYGPTWRDSDVVEIGCEAEPWGLEALRRAKVLGLLPLTALEQAQQRVEVLEWENERLRAALKKAIEMVDGHFSPEEIDPVVDLMYLALSGTEGGQG